MEWRFLLAPLLALLCVTSAMAQTITTSHNETTNFLNTVTGKVPRSYSGTTDTLSAATDCGGFVHSTGGSGVAETVPNNLPVGCNSIIEQVGAGQVTVGAGSGATQHSDCATVATNHQYSMLLVHVESNSDGAHAVYDVVGGCT